MSDASADIEIQHIRSDAILVSRRRVVLSSDDDDDRDLSLGPQENLGHLAADDHQPEAYVPTTDIEAMIFVLVSLSEEYLSQAHSLMHLAIKNKDAMLQYRKLIFASIKVLTAVVNKLTKIPPTTEVSIYLKLAQIYYSETSDYDKCEVYLNKAITISSRTNLLHLQFQAEYFAAVIISSDNSKIALKYLNSKIEEFKSLGYVHWVRIFELLKINLLLTIEPKTALINLKVFNGYSNLHENLKQFTLLMEANLKLYQGSPSEALVILKETRQRTYDIVKLECKPHLVAMMLLNELKCYIQLNDFHKAKDTIAEINKFIEAETKQNLSDWPSDGSFNLEVSIPVNPTKFKEYPFKVTWLSIEEVQILLWLYSGICYLLRYYEKNKAIKYLSTALTLADKYMAKLKERGFTRKVVSLSNGDSLSPDMNCLNLKLMRLKFIKFQIIYYQCYYSMLLNEQEPNTNKKNVKNLHDQIESLSELEKKCFKSPFIKNLYLLALISQNEGNLELAKLLYIKLREASAQRVSNQYNSQESKLTYFCSSIGIGGKAFEPKSSNSEIYIYSTLNYLLILESELSKLKNINSTSSLSSYKDTLLFAASRNNDQIEKITKERNILLGELNLWFAKAAKQLAHYHQPNTFITSNKLLIETKHIFDIIFNQLSHYQIVDILANITGNPEDLKDTISNTRINNNQSQTSSLVQDLAPELYAVANFLKAEHSPDSITKQKFLLQCFVFSKLSRNMVLRYLSGMWIYENYKRFGDTKEAELQLKKNESIKQGILEMFVNTRKF